MKQLILLLGVVVALVIPSTASAYCWDRYSYGHWVYVGHWVYLPGAWHTYCSA